MFNFNYDPQRQAYDTGLWKSLVSAPTISGTKMRVTSAKAIQYGDCLRGDYKFRVTIPAAPTAAYLTGGSSATAVIATWNAVTDGEFTITINEETVDVIGLDFSAAADMDEVAVIIQDGINAEISGREAVTVAWDTDHFVITGLSVVSVTSAVADGEGTDISGAGATTFMDGEVNVGTPTSGDSKYFGLTQLASGAMAAFRVFGNKLRMITATEGGGQIVTDLPFPSAGWHGAEVVFRISWAGQAVTYYVNNIQVAVHMDEVIPRTTMSIFVQNDDADNLDFGSFDAQGVESYL
jgi:hypothetical protein